MFKTKNVKLETYSDREFKLLEDLVYEGACGDHVVPAGFVTDFASVPAMVQWLIPPYGKYAMAAIVHDWYCIQLAKGTSQVSSRDVDGIFRRIMRELGVPVLRRWLMWTGVRWGALFNEHRRKGIAIDLLPMVLWSILASPVVILGSLGAGLGLAVDSLFEKLIGRFIK